MNVILQDQNTTDGNLPTTPLPECPRKVDAVSTPFLLLRGDRSSPVGTAIARRCAPPLHVGLDTYSRRGRIPGDLQGVPGGMWYPFRALNGKRYYYPNMRGRR